MFKKICGGVISLVLILAFWGCSDSELSASKKSMFSCFEYALDDETQITGYKEEDSDGNVCSLEVEIPDEITSIAEGAFQDKGLTSVEIPNSVTNIGANAFAGNSFSSHVYIPNDAATVDNTAFDSTVTVAQEGTASCFEISSNALSDYYCMAQEVTIPDGVTSIEDGAFEDKGMTSMTFPESITDIGANAFTGNSFPSSYIVSIPNESATVDDMAFDQGVIVAIEGTDSCFEITNNALSDYYCMAQEVTVPDSVTSIENGAFEGKGLTSVTLPSALESIGNNAFKDNDLMDLTVPDTLTDIGDNAFSGNSNLAWIIVPNTSASVGTDAFPNGHSVLVAVACFEFDATDTSQINDYYDNENNDSNDPACPRDVVIPQGATAIGVQAFANNDLTSVIIPDSVTSIGANAFANNNLTSVTIPSSVTSIEIYAFINNSLDSVTISEGVISLEEGAFFNNSLSSVIIPDSVTSLGQTVFGENSLTSVTISSNVPTLQIGVFRDNDLTSVTIPDSVTIIEGHTFVRNALTSVTIGSGIERIKADAFTGNDDLTDVCIEANSADVTVESGAFPAGATLTYDSDGDCTNN